MDPRVAKLVRRISAGLAVLALSAAAVALGDVPRAKIADGPLMFPRNFAAGVLYGTVDRPDLNEYRELYAPAAAIAAVRAGHPLPLGTVLTMVTYSVKRDAAGKPVTDERGRFIKDEMSALLVMEKRRDAPAHRLSEADGINWRFQMFRPDASVEQRANLRGCAECHQKRRAQDHVFTLDKMKRAPAAVR